MPPVSRFGEGPQDAGDQRRLRHAMMGWREWMLREFLRYVYGLGVLALLVMGPLQMADSWLPVARAPVIEPAVVGAIAIAFIVGVVYLAFSVYHYLWAKDGLVDRVVRRHEKKGGSADDAPLEEE